jgi:hypothetical protein
MDPITTALIAGVAKLAEPAVKDGYEGLKALLKRKFGEKSEVIAAVESVEQKPESAGRRETLAEEVLAVKAPEDPEIVAAAQALVGTIQASGGSTVVTQHVQGNQNVFSGTGNVTITDRRA